MITINLNWLAGFFDAEGCVRITKRSGNRNGYDPAILIGRNSIMQEAVKQDE